MGKNDDNFIAFCDELTIALEISKARSARTFILCWTLLHSYIGGYGIYVGYCCRNRLSEYFILEHESALSLGVVNG